ncbi:AEC family transporter [Zhouia sp. PK063]|uniref:AEC family transporter n=1 Tax=Zhouia sp. PK063 TaxID=3373602 RepID=UPI0037966E07
MNIALQKTLTFILFILIGIALKLKFKKPDETVGLKKIILNLALPSTIFIALLKIEIEASLILLPFMAMGLNIALFLITPILLSVIGISSSSPSGRTAKMLIPSLAPGLSCFPFITEFLGDHALAKAAMTDLGNKIFVLFILYIIAMNWHYKLNRDKQTNRKSKLKNLLLAMINEPVNVFIFIALILVGAGLHLSNFPDFLENTISRLSAIMTPLVLLFIGLAVKIKKKQFSQICSLLLLRAGFSFLLIAVVNLLLHFNPETILLITAFALSACSFWPFAHVSAVLSIEKNTNENQKTFDADFAIGILAFSLPLSTLLILGILSTGETFTSSRALFTIALVCCIIGITPILFKKIRLSKNSIFLKLSNNKA